MHGVTMSTKYTSNEKKLYSQLKELARAYPPMEVAMSPDDERVERYAKADDRAHTPTLPILKNRRP